MKMVFTENLLIFCSELHDLLGQDTKPLFRVGLPEGRFWFAVEDEDNVTINDDIVFDEEGLIIVCDSDEHEILKGTTVDFELYGLDRRIVYKDKRFKHTHISGDLHPAFEEHHV